MQACLCSALLILASPVAASAIDLDSIDRSIAKLPTLKSGTPTYCLLVFGEKADTRIWLVRDSNTIYIDRNGNGDLTDSGEAIAYEQYRTVRCGSITERDGKTTHTDLNLEVYTGHTEISVRLNGKLEQRAFRDARGKLEFNADPKKAPIIHFNGPITMDSFWVQKPLLSTANRRVSILVGTPGVGPGTFAIFPCECFLTEANNIFPKAEIDFPHKDPAKPPIRVTLNIGED